MALIVEDGTGVVGANSFASVATIRALADARGDHLAPASDAAVERYAIKAMDMLQGFRARYQGAKTYPTTINPLQWPRTGVKIDCEAIGADAVPQQMVDAQCVLTCVQGGGVDICPIGTTAFITEDTIGPITTKFSDKHGGTPGDRPVIPAVDDLLAPLFTACGQGNLFVTVRA